MQGRTHAPTVGITAELNVVSHKRPEYLVNFLSLPKLQLPHVIHIHLAVLAKFSLSAIYIRSPFSVDQNTVIRVSPCNSLIVLNHSTPHSLDAARKLKTHKYLTVCGTDLAPWGIRTIQHITNCRPCILTCDVGASTSGGDGTNADVKNSGFMGC